MNAVTPKVETILAQAVDIAEPAQRQAFVEQACHGDAELQRRVERMVAHHFQAGSFLERPAVVVDDASTAAWQRDESTHALGTLIGPYKLLEQIGEGGMGLVYVAEQQQPIKRRVALKIIKPGMDSKQVIARFEAERQALALMDHPHIARVYDAGTTAEGRPYFVMELVKGRPITDYCDQQRLGTRQRLELFLDVCQAVQHAHQKGIIHRDLKPSNVLVEVHDVRPVVKVIDFGIAKATGPQLTEKTLYTGLAQLVGTPLYMSPEQAGLSSLDVDTRSDVYSLGVLLYELLTGTTPFDSETLKKAGYDEMRRIIREEEPPRPSGRLSTLEQAHLSTIAERRGLEPRRLGQQLRGELDWIVMKALEKDRNRRYESASAFAADVQRYLADEPVLACPPSHTYRLWKFTRRHKAGLGAAAALLVVILLAGSGWVWLGQRQAAAAVEAGVALKESRGLGQQERWPEALSAARRAEGVLAGVGTDGDLRQQAKLLIKDLELAQALQGAEVRGTAVKEGHFNEDATDAAYQDAFQRYGLDVDGLDPAAAAERIRACFVHPQVVAALDHWAILRRAGKKGGWRPRLTVAQLADPDPGRNRLRAVLEAQDPKKALEKTVAAGLDEDLPVRTIVLLARLVGTPSTTGMSGKHVTALLARAQQRHPDTFWINESLGYILHKSRPPHLEEAIRFFTVGVALQPQSPGAHLNLGTALEDKGRLDEAIAEFREAIRLKKDYAVAHNDLGNALKDKGQLDDAIAEYRKAIRLKKDFAGAHYNLGIALEGKGQVDDAIAEYRKAIRLKKDYVEAHINLGKALHGKGQLDDAIAEYREAIRLNKDFALAHNNLGFVLQGKGQLDEAIAEYREAIRLKKDFAEAHDNLGNALADKDQLNEAIAEYREAIRLKKDSAEAHNNLGTALQGKGQVDEAIAEYREAIRLKKDFAEAHINLGNALEGKGQVDEAIAEYREAIRLKKDFAEAHINLGNALKDKGQLDGAIAEYRKAIRLKKDLAEAHYSLGSALQGKGQVDEAIAEYREAIRLKKDFALAHNNLGFVLQGKGQVDEAIAEYRKAIRLKKDYAEAHNNLGNTLRGKGQLDDAIAEYREAIRLKKDFAEAHYNLGVVLETKGRLDEAIACFQEAIRLKPGFAMAHQDLAWLLATCSDVRFRNARLALTHVKQATELQPGRPEIINTLGVVLYRNGAWQAAVDALLKSTRLRQGGDSTEYFFLAMAYWQLKEKDRARAWYGKGVAWMDKHNPQDEELKHFRAEATALLGLSNAANALQPKK